MQSKPDVFLLLFFYLLAPISIVSISVITEKKNPLA